MSLTWMHLFARGFDTPRGSRSSRGQRRGNDGIEDRLSTRSRRLIAFRKGTKVEGGIFGRLVAIKVNTRLGNRE
jgi:hypothetical protein